MFFVLSAFCTLTPKSRADLGCSLNGLLFVSSAWTVSWGRGQGLGGHLAQQGRGCLGANFLQCLGTGWLKAGSSAPYGSLVAPLSPLAPISPLPAYFQLCPGLLTLPNTVPWGPPGATFPIPAPLPREIPHSLLCHC